MALGLPLYGLILGCIMVGVYSVLNPFSSPLYAAIIASILYILSYGFLHLEAVADVVDGLYARHSGKDVYQVMKEPQIGAMGAIATFLVILLKIAALGLLLPNGIFLPVIAVIVLSRLIALTTLYSATFHKDSHFIDSLKSSLDQTSMVTVFIILAMALLLISKLILLPIALLAGWIIQRFLLKSLGFLNGDGLGFIIELTEVILLNALIVL